MKRILSTLIIVLIATSCFSADYGERALYWCHQNGHTEATETLKEVLTVRTDGKKGDLYYISYSFQSWKFAGPSKETLDALDGPTVDAWIIDQKKDVDADYDNWTDREKAMIKVLMTYINQIRVALGQPAKTKAEVIEDLKAEL